MQQLNKNHKKYLWSGTASYSTNKKLSSFIGFINAGVIQEVISYYCYVFENNKIDENGWFMYHKNKLQSEMGISEKDLQKAFNFAIKNKIFEFTRRGMPLKSYVRVNPNYHEILDDYLYQEELKRVSNADVIGKPQTEVLETANETSGDSERDFWKPQTTALLYSNTSSNTSIVIKEKKQKKITPLLVLTDDEKIILIKEKALSKEFDYAVFEKELGKTQILTQIELCENHYVKSSKYKEKEFNPLLTFNWLLRQLEFKKTNKKIKTNQQIEKFVIKEGATKHNLIILDD
jgi:hypothetical protein